MFTEIITSKVRKELKKMNFYYSGEILPLKVVDDIWTLNIYKQDKAFVIRYYDFDNSEYYINKYLILEKYGIKIPKIISYSNKLIIFEDYNDINKYERLNSEIITREIIEKISEWYKNLHSNFQESIINYKDYFNVSNLNKVMKKYNLQYNKNLEYICDNFYNIKLKLSKLKNSFVLNDFSLDNLFISKESGEIVCDKCDRFGNGFCYMDICKIREGLNKENYDIFASKYGSVSEDECVIGEVASKIIDLYLSINDETISTRIRKILDEIVSDKFENKIRSIVEWY